MITLAEPYAPRPIRFLELWEPAGWRLKVYGVAYRGARPGETLVVAAKSAAQAQLPDPSLTRSCYGVGFLGVHEGRGANLVFVDWWAHENELHHHVHLSKNSAPTELIEITSTGLIACVWDLRVIGFERDAWVETVLANPEGPDVEAYLARRLSEEA